MFRGTRSSIEMLKGYTDGECLGTPDVEDGIGTEQNATLWANWRYIRSGYKRIQLYRTALQGVSGPIRIKLKVSFGAYCLFLGQIVIFRANFFLPPSKMPSRTPMSIGVDKTLLYSSRIQTTCARKHNEASRDSYLTITLTGAVS